MSAGERELFTPKRQEFQSVIGYRDPAMSPPLVVRQTENLLGLYYHGAVFNPRPAEEYLHDYTMGYLKAARQGASTIYDRNGLLRDDVDLEVREAAHHAAVIMSFLRERAESPYFPVGFSSRGILRAPSTEREYLARIRELQAGIAQVVAGMVDPRATLEAYPPVFRVFQFFKVGSGLPIKLTESEEKQKAMQQEQLNDLLGGIDISL